MHRTLIPLVLLAVLAAPSQASACTALPAGFDYSGYGQDAELLVEDLGSLPEQTAVLAGRFHGDGNTLHPALAISRDGGRSWTFIDVLYSAAGLSRLQTQGEASIWGVVSHRQEGTDQPQYLLRSRDAGRSWCALPLDDLDTLASVESLRFFDERHGLIVFTEFPFGNGKIVYQTSDGGDSWVPVWRPEVDRTFLPGDGFAYPGAVDPPEHAPLWSQVADAYKITGLLRVRRQDDWHVIEHYGYDDDAGWTERSRLARSYRLTDSGPRPKP